MPNHFGIPANAGDFYNSDKLGVARSFPKLRTKIFQSGVEDLVSGNALIIENSPLNTSGDSYIVQFNDGSVMDNVSPGDSYYFDEEYSSILITSVSGKPVNTKCGFGKKYITNTAASSSGVPIGSNYLLAQGGAFESSAGGAYTNSFDSEFFATPSGNPPANGAGQFSNTLDLGLFTLNISIVNLTAFEGGQPIVIQGYPPFNTATDLNRGMNVFDSMGYLVSQVGKIRLADVLANTDPGTGVARFYCDGRGIAEINVNYPPMLAGAGGGSLSVQMTWSNQNSEIPLTMHPRHEGFSYDPVTSVAGTPTVVMPAVAGQQINVYQVMANDAGTAAITSSWVLQDASATPVKFTPRASSPAEGTFNTGPSIDPIGVSTTGVNFYSVNGTTATFTNLSIQIIYGTLNV